MTYVNCDDPACCRICGQWLSGEVKEHCHADCLSQMLYEEWMAEIYAERYADVLAIAEETIEPSQPLYGIQQ